VADCARAEDEALAGDGFAASRAYWKNQLAGLPALDLSILRAAGQGPGVEGHCVLRFSAEESSAWQALDREHGETPFMALYAALAAVLARYSGQVDFGVGAVIANREAPGAESLLGFFTNTVVLRTDLGGDPTVRELLERARTTAIGAI